MKKKIPKIKLAFKKYFIFFIVLIGMHGFLRAQNIDFAAGCPNAPDSLAKQVKGISIVSSSSKWAIPSITAVNPPGGGAITMSITNIDVFSGGFPTGEGCHTSGSCNPFIIHGITFSTSGANFTVTGTPDLAPLTYLITVTASAGETSCSRTYTLAVYATVNDRGDPHLTTTDGVHYDFQSAGEFTALRGDSTENFEIQTRQTPVATNGPGTDSYSGLSTCVSLNTAVAAQVGTHRVTYQPNINGIPDSSGMQLRVDGTLTTLGANGLDLGSGGRIVKLPGGIEIDFPNGASLVATSNWWSSYSVWYLNVDVHRTNATKGIMGVIAPRSWLPKLPDGTSVGPMPKNGHDRFVQLYGKFADAWRVTDKTSLFDYAPGTSTATFTDKNWPAENAESCSIPNHIPQTPIGLEVAEQLCRDIIDSNMRANAIFDVMVTGEASFAKAYLATQQIQISATETTVKASKDTTKNNEPVTFTATVNRKYSAGKDILAGSVEFIIDGKKFEQVKLEANGLAILTTTSLTVGLHHIVAIFTPDSGSTAFSSSSLDITHTVLAGNTVPILYQWWFWVIILLIIAGIIIALLRKKKSP